MAPHNLDPRDLVVMDGACWCVVTTELRKAPNRPDRWYYLLQRVGDETDGESVVPCQMLDRLIAIGEAARYVDALKAPARG